MPDRAERRVPLTLWNAVMHASPGLPRDLKNISGGGLCRSRLQL